ncbi:hypothetical protein RI367_004278 [Sorochytrium milnesiophthora]
MTHMRKLATPAEIKAFVDSYETFLLDMDGVLWSGDTLFDGVNDALDYLRSQGKRILFVTNNSTKSRQSYVAKFRALGLHGQVDEIFGSSYSAAVYLKNVVRFPSDKKVYVIGQQGIVDELASVGIQSCGAEADKTPLNSLDDTQSIQPDPQIGAVLCGFDVHINYNKLAKAYTYLQNPDCLFLATNTDATYPFGGRTFPGTGSLVAPLVTATGRQPTVLGKPSKTMLDVVLASGKDVSAHTSSSDPKQERRERMCMIGDRLDTDIAFGLGGGIGTLLVLTGVTTEEELHSPSNSIRPAFYTAGLRSLALAKDA